MIPSTATLSLRAGVGVIDASSHVWLLPEKSPTPLALAGSAYEIWTRLAAGSTVAEVIDDLAVVAQTGKAEMSRWVQGLAADLVNFGIVDINEGEEPMTTHSILTVCTGNICRSLFAERMLRKHLEGVDITLSSAGTGAEHSLDVPEQVTRQLMKYGLDGAPHSPTPVSEDLVRQASLILTATADHRSRILAMVPTAFRKTFTMLEAASAIESMHGESPDDFTTKVRSLATARTAIPSGTLLDCPDPYGGSDADYENMGVRLAPALRRIASFLREAN